MSEYPTENLTLSSFLILSKIIHHSGIYERQFVTELSSLPPEIIALSHIPTRSNSIYQVLTRLKKMGLIEIRTPKDIFPTMKGEVYYATIFDLIKNGLQGFEEKKSLVASTNPTPINRTKIIEKKQIQSKQTTPFQKSAPLSKKPVLSKLVTTSHDYEEELKEIFIEKIQNLKLMINEDRLTACASNLIEYWVNNSIQNYTDDSFLVESSNRVLRWLFSDTSVVEEEDKNRIRDVVSKVWELYFESVVL